MLGQRRTAACVSGVCEYEWEEEGTPCQSDGGADGFCSWYGECTGFCATKSCDDNNPCTMDTCMEDYDGMCMNEYEAAPAVLASPWAERGSLTMHCVPLV